MPVKSTYDYALIRVVPRVELGEFINVGVVLYCRTARFLAVRIDFDEERISALAPDLNVDEVRKHLSLLTELCDGIGPVGELGQADTFHWIVAPHSTVIQASPVHSGLCTDPAEALDQLLETVITSRRNGAVSFQTD